MHVIDIHAAHMASMNSRYHHITLQSTLYWLTNRAYKDHKDVTNITSYNESKLGLSTDKINKWLREALYNKHAIPRGTRLLSGTILQSSSSSFRGGDSIGGPGSHPKNIIKKTWVQSRTHQDLRRAILLMHMYQGKGGGVHHAEVPALTWLVLNYDYQTLR